VGMQIICSPSSLTRCPRRCTQESRAATKKAVTKPRPHIQWSNRFQHRQLDWSESLYHQKHGDQKRTLTFSSTAVYDASLLANSTSLKPVALKRRYHNRAPYLSHSGHFARCAAPSQTRIDESNQVTWVTWPLMLPNNLMGARSLRAVLQLLRTETGGSGEWGIGQKDTSGLHHHQRRTRKEKKGKGKEEHDRHFTATSSCLSSLSGFDGYRSLPRRSRRLWAPTRWFVGCSSHSLTDITHGAQGNEYFEIVHPSGKTSRVVFAPGQDEAHFETNSLPIQWQGLGGFCFVCL
jgi:hypothetical protein